MIFWPGRDARRGERHWFERTAQGSGAERKTRIDATAKLSVRRQAIVLGISRGSVYDQPRPVSDADLKLMHRTRKLHMEFPFAGSRMLQGLLLQEGFKDGLHVATLMKRMGRVGERHWFERTRAGGALPQSEHLKAMARHGTPEIFNTEHGRAIGSSGHATSGQPVHLDRVHQGAGGPGNQDQHGR